MMQAGDEAVCKANEKIKMQKEFYSKWNIQMERMRESYVDLLHASLAQ